MTTPYPLAGQRARAEDVSPTAWAAMTLLNSWSNTGGGVVTAQWRVLPLENMLEVIGNIVHANIAGGGASQIATMTDTPASQQNFLCNVTATANLYASSTPQMPRLLLTTAGALFLENLPANTTGADFHGFFSLDA